MTTGAGMFLNGLDKVAILTKHLTLGEFGLTYIGSPAPDSTCFHRFQRWVDMVHFEVFP